MAKAKRGANGIEQTRLGRLRWIRLVKREGVTGLTAAGDHRV